MLVNIDYAAAWRIDVQLCLLLPVGDGRIVAIRFVASGCWGFWRPSFLQGFNATSC